MDQDIAEITNLMKSILESEQQDGLGVEPVDELFSDEGSMISDVRLNELIHDNSHFPTPELGDFLKIKCLRELDRGDDRAAAFTLLHSQAHSFRHQVISQYSRRIRKREDELAKKRKNNESDDIFDEDEDEDETRANEIQKRSMSFQSMASSDNSSLAKMIQKLPEDWRIVHISVQPHSMVRFKKTPTDQAILESNLPLIISAFSCGADSNCLVQRIPILESNGRPTIMKEFYDIVQNHKLIYQKTDQFVQSAYKKARDDLDCRLMSLLETIQDKWLGLSKFMLLGKPRCLERLSKIEEAIKTVSKLLKFKPDQLPRPILFYLLDGASLLTCEQLKTGCFQVTDKKNSLQILVKFVGDFGKVNPCKDVERCPVVFVLDKEIQNLPWESLPNLRNQPCSRVPSVFFLSSLYETHEMNKCSVVKMGVSSNKIFYVLNPNKDLEKTQKRLEAPFRQMSLGEGVVGAWPSFPQLQEALSTMDAFMYCGHGSRLKTMTSQEIEKLRVRAVPLLFGCNSGKLERIGRAFDPIGAASSYLVATSPCLLGFLWSVTDKDVDDWTIGFLEHWLGKGKEPKERDFVRAIAEKRFDFSRLLNSAATVVYGLPSFLDNGKY